MYTNAHGPGGGAASSEPSLYQRKIMKHRANNNDVIATPASTGAQNYENLNSNHPIVAAAAASERRTSTLGPNNDIGMIGQTNDSCRNAELEAAKHSSNASSENVNGRVHLDNESFRETFLEDPTNTTNFFISYYKSALKRVPNKSVLNNLLGIFADAISPQGNEQRREAMNIKGVDDFPLKEILSIFIAANQLSFGKRVVEGYIWLSCQETPSRKKCSYNDAFLRLHSSSPNPLVSACDPLVNLCNALGWDKLDDLLVGSVEKLCEFGDVPMALDFCQNIASKSTPSGGEVAHRPQVCARMFKVVYGKRFHSSPSRATRGFIDYSVKHIVPTEVLISFVDVMSPPNPENRRIPSEALTYDFPLERLLSHLVARECYTLGKRVIDGYIWLSCQEINGQTHLGPSGPNKLIEAGAPLRSICDALGWNELEAQLVEAVKMLCTHGTPNQALQLCQMVSGFSGRSSSFEDKERSRVTLMMVKAVQKTTIARFRHRPTATAQLVVAYAKKLSNPSALITAFVDEMSPVDHAHRQAPLATLCRFPLKEILSLLVERKYFNLGKRVIEGYIWLSCQEVRNIIRSPPRGPTLLVSAADPLVSLCNVLGWNELEASLIESVQKIFQYGDSGSSEHVQTAIDLIEKIHPPPIGDSDCSRVCVKLATIACDEIFKGWEAMHKNYSYNRRGIRHLIPFYTKFVRLIAKFCPTMSPRFETFAKNFDVDQMLYPLLSDENFRSSASVNDAGKGILRQLTTHCAQLLHARVSSDPDVVTAWTVPSAHTCQNAKFSRFLLSQCKETFDWKVRKSDHEGLKQELQVLVNTGEVTCRTYQPPSSCYRSGPYHFKITKLKTCRVRLDALSCSCSSDVNEKKVKQEPASCLHETTKEKRAKDEEMWQSLKAYLTPEEIRGLSSQKRKADALGGDGDDDVVITGVAGVAETIAKRVKAAEDAGEVIQIL